MQPPRKTDFKGSFQNQSQGFRLFIVLFIFRYNIIINVLNIQKTVSPFLSSSTILIMNSFVEPQMILANINS